MLRALALALAARPQMADRLERSVVVAGDQVRQPLQQAALVAPVRIIRKPRIQRLRVRAAAVVVQVLG